MNTTLLIIIGSVLMILLLSGICYYQIRVFTLSYVLPKKPIDDMTRKELIIALGSHELNTSRWTEDLIEVLIKKNIITRQDLPEPVKIHLEYKNALREKLKTKE